MVFLQESILKVVAYFDVFDYPVTIEEIKFFLDQPCKDDELQTALYTLIEKRVLFSSGNFYSARNDHLIIIRRLEGNHSAKKEIRKARKVSAFLTWFPFIKGIAVSGSLSKSFAYKDSDLDFFIITNAGRLWLARFFFILFYRIISFTGMKGWFCLNYFIAENSPEIEEKNIYTATEIATLLPCHGSDVFKSFFETNNWAHDFFPNHLPKKYEGKNYSPKYSKRFTEWLLNNKFGDRLDTVIMHFYKRRWKKLSALNIFTEKGFQLGGMVVSKDVCKPFPQHFQQTILNRFENKFRMLKSKMTRGIPFEEAVLLKKPA